MFKNECSTCFNKKCFTEISETKFPVDVNKIYLFRIKFREYLINEAEKLATWGKQRFLEV
jgi:hypothetical protein